MTRQNVLGAVAMVGLALMLSTGSAAAQLAKDIVGVWTVSGTDLNFHIEGSTFPNWTGTNQKRINLTIAGDELKYTQPTPSGGGPAAMVVWRRVK